MKKYYVTMTDKFMSGWGMAAGRTNKLIIECDTFAQAAEIERNAHKRPEMKYINIRSTKPRYPHALESWKTYSDMGGPWLDGGH